MKSNTVQKPNTVENTPVTSKETTPKVVTTQFKYKYDPKNIWPKYKQIKPQKWNRIYYILYL